ncbi:MAG: hypothetical protein ACXAEF_00425 [Candidatus Thorarchaeota archaeon]
MDHGRSSYIRNKIIKWYRLNGRKFPWRESSNPYQILIAEMMLRRTTATAVMRVFPDFIRKYPDIRSLSLADENEIRNSIESLGLHIQRANHLKEMAVTVVTEYSGEITSVKNHLLSLPGVGPYVAAAVCNFAFGDSVHMVDGNITHLIQRVLGIAFSGPEDKLVWSIMKRLGGRKQNKHLYWGIIDMVALLCLRKNPRCSQCPLANHCAFNLNNES